MRLYSPERLVNPIDPITYPYTIDRVNWKCEPKQIFFKIHESNLNIQQYLQDENWNYIYDENGIDTEKLTFLKELKNVKRGRIKEYADKFGCQFVEGSRPWAVKGDIAFPSATQNEINEDSSKMEEVD